MEQIKDLAARYPDIKKNAVKNDGNTKNYTFLGIPRRDNMNPNSLDEKDREILLFSIIKASDISNPSRHRNIAVEWQHKIMQEFWNQGDKEKSLGIPTSFGCDRNAFKELDSVPTFALNFIDFIVMPLFTCIALILPNVILCTNNLQQNRAYWDDLRVKAKILPEQDANSIDDKNDIKEKGWEARKKSAIDYDKILKTLNNDIIEPNDDKFEDAKDLNS